MGDNVAAWVAIAVTVFIACVGAFLAWWKWWLEREFANVKTDTEEVKTETTRRIELVRSEVFTQAARTETTAARASAEVARLELKMAEQRSEFMLKTDFERSMDRYFDPLFLRLDTLEKRWEQFLLSRING